MLPTRHYWDADTSARTEHSPHRPPGRDLEWVLPLVFVASAATICALVSFGLGLL